MSVACFSVGSRVAYDGGVWAVLALAGDRVTVEERASGQTRSVLITHLLSSPGSRLLAVPKEAPVRAIGPLLANLTAVELSARSANARRMSGRF